MTEIAFTIPGDPVPWARARVSHEGGRTRMITPANMRGYKEAVAWAGRAAMMDREPLEEPVEMHVRFCLPVPKSWPLRRQDAALDGKELPAKRPDLDNYVKMIADALNGVVYVDDAQIVTLWAWKRYANPAHVWVKVMTA